MIRQYFIQMFIVAILASTAYAETRIAASCSQSNVSAALSAASSGDIVQVPAGTCTWTNELSIPDGVSIFGAGKNNTHITVATGGAAFSTGSDNWRVSGFDFIQSGGSSFVVWISSSTDFRIDNNRMTNFSVPVGNEGTSRGVIDNNEIIGGSNNGDGITLYGPGRSAWSLDTGLGGPNFIFIEDNTFDSGGVDMQHVIAANNGAKYVFRNNTITESSGGRYAAMIDAHGWCYNRSAGTRAIEIYGNTLTANSDGDFRRMMFIRGATGAVYNNTIVGTGNMTYPIIIYNYRTDDSCPAVSEPTCQDAEGYPCIDQVGRGKNQASEPMYFWNNTFNDAGGAETIANDLAGRGWPSFMVEGVDYFEDTAMPGYTPYTYPHPLRSGITPPPPPPPGDIPTPKSPTWVE